jgi:uncharacterized protein YabE (DUF348 family)
MKMINPKSFAKMRQKKEGTPKKGGRRSLFDWHKHPFAVPVVTFMALFFASIASFIFLNGQTIGASDSHVVHLYVDGQNRIVPTRALTVGDALRAANIELREGDVTEPAQDSPIISQDFNVNVYRAKPITVIDEKGQKISTKVPESTPTEMAKKAGVKIYPEDRVMVAAPDEALRDGVIGAKVVIDRATPAYINLYGTSIVARTHAKTVGDLLKEKGIKAVEGDTVQPAPNTPLTPNTQIFVTRQGKQISSVEEVIAAPVERINDPNTPSGTTVVKEPGSAGKKVVTYEIELQNGKEVSRKPIQEVVAVEPVKQVVAVGSKIIISNPSANVQLGQQIAAEMGYTGADFQCIYQVFQRESGWNHLAGNASGAYGIPQALPGSKMGPGWQTDPAVQIRWGINYMKRYGGPCGTWQHWQIHHNY